MVRSILVWQVHHRVLTKEAAKSNDETSLPLFSTSHWRAQTRDRRLASPSLSSTLLSCLFDQAAPEKRSRFLCRDPGLNGIFRAGLLGCRSGRHNRQL